MRAAVRHVHEHVSRLLRLERSEVPRLAVRTRNVDVVAKVELDDAGAREMFVDETDTLMRLLGSLLLLDRQNLQRFGESLLRRRIVLPLSVARVLDRQHDLIAGRKREQKCSDQFGVPFARFPASD